MAQEKAKKKSLRLALIASEHTISDYTTVLERLLVGMADESIPVALICPPRVDVDDIITGNVEVIRYPFIELPMAGSYNRRTVYERLAPFEPTVVHCLCESRAMFARRLSRSLGLPYILSVNSVQNRWSRFSISGKRCARVIVPSDSIEANVRNIHPRLTGNIQRFDYGTFIADEPGCFSDNSQLPSIVTTHPLHDASDFESLFGAVRHLIIDGYEFVVVIMGSGRAESQMHKMLKAFDLLEHVIHIPRLMPWRSILAAADIFVRPQPLPWFDPLLLEAMAAGCAVAACTGGVDDLLIEDKTAAIFEQNNELSIMKTLQQLLDGRQQARTLAESAQHMLRTEHSASKMVSDLLLLYRKAQDWPLP